MSTPRRFAQVAVDTAGFTAEPGILTYTIPSSLRSALRPGQIVRVPLRKQLVTGWVTGISDDEPDFALRPVAEIIDETYVMPEWQQRLAIWLARETASSIFSTGALFFPPGSTRKAVEQFELIDPEEPPPDELSKSESKLWHFLSVAGPSTFEDLASEFGRVPRTALQELEANGHVLRSLRHSGSRPKSRLESFVRLVAFDPSGLTRAPAQLAVLEYLQLRKGLGDEIVPLTDLTAKAGFSRSVIDALAGKDLVEIVRLPATDGIGKRKRGVAPPVLTADQAAALREIETGLAQRHGKVLLRGVTGSGKTEIYLRATARVLAKGQTAVILLPEIALAEEIAKRFDQRFPGQVTLLHSELTPAKRLAAWEGVRNGQFRVVIGPRSALFAPVTDLGLVVIDEEHEPAYKQETEPRYHARSVAEWIAHEWGAGLILGSATPATETFFRATQGDLQLLTLPDRLSPLPTETGTASSLEMPDVMVVDMRKEAHAGRVDLISDSLNLAIERALARREQALLLLNRRGTATTVVCTQCGRSVDCPKCDTPLVYHQDRGALICHRCNYRSKPIRICPHCSGQMVYLGAGTQRIEADARRHFPKARVLRVDRDSVQRMGGSGRMMEALARGEFDIIVGTQMIAKGIDLPLVTTVGVIYGDAPLHLPDFRSSERAFQLISQVAGRAGRRAPGAVVVVQTYQPENYAIAAAADHDYLAFYNQEITFRRQFGYPPFKRLIQWTGRNTDDVRCEEDALELKERVLDHIEERQVMADLFGPAPAFIARIRNEYRWQLLMKTDDAGLEAILDGLPTRPGWAVDVDPLSLL